MKMDPERLHLFALPTCVRVDKKTLGEIRRNKGSMFEQDKIDGHRRYFCKLPDGSLRCYGKRDSTSTGQRLDIIDKVPGRIVKMVAQIPFASVIDCELYVEGHQATEVPRALKSRPHDVRLSCFGILMWDGVHSSAIDWNLKEEMEMLDRLGLPRPRTERIQFFFDMHSDLDDFKAFYDQYCRRRNLEGVVFKRRGHTPAYKHKRVPTYDVIVTGTTAANYGVTGKYVGLIGALVCSVYDDFGNLVEVCRCSGMTDQLREEFSCVPPIGRVVEVAAQLSASNGRLRHPQFKRLRDDKDPKDCTLKALRETC